MNTIRPGHLISDRYLVTRILHEGATATVAEAQHQSVNQRVALKLLSPELIVDDAAVDRFRQEALLVSSLQSPCVVQVFDFDVLEGGSPFLVMERLEGPTLDEVVGERGPLPVEQAVGWVLDACGVVSEMHAAGVVHRNLSARNLLLDRRYGESLKVIGFSVARHPSLGLGAADALLGTPATMSPEQLRAPQDVDARSDLWALGVILYELLAGAPPFAGQDVAQVAVAIVSSAPPPLGQRRADLPPGLEAVILQALAKSPAGRPPSVEAWAAALRPFASRATAG